MCAVEGRWHIAAKDFEGARRARRSVRNMLAALNIASRELEDVELVVGELAVNALRYTDGAVQIAISHCDSQMQVEVLDTGECFDPATAAMNAVYSVGGRGIAIVKALSEKFQVRGRRDGCAVIATLVSTCVREERNAVLIEEQE